MDRALAPVFVDDTGRKHRRLARTGYVTGALLLAYPVALLVAATAGDGGLGPLGSLDHPFGLGSGSHGTEAGTAVGSALSLSRPGAQAGAPGAAAKSPAAVTRPGALPGLLAGPTASGVAGSRTGSLPLVPPRPAAAAPPATSAPAAGPASHLTQPGSTVAATHRNSTAPVRSTTTAGR